MTMMKRCAVMIATTGLAAAAPAMAQDTYSFTFNQKASIINSAFTATAPFTGSFIGNYNAQTNPGGTRTLLGAFGTCSSGNQTVTFTGSGGAEGAPVTSPTGDFTLRVDTTNNRAVLYNFSADLLGGTEPTIGTSANMTYQAFRTCAPTGFFPSLNIPFDLGDAVVTRLTATQVCSPSVGTLSQVGPGQFAFSIPTVIVVDAGLTLNGDPQKTAPTEVAINFAGTVSVGDVIASVAATLSVMQHQVIDGPIAAADDVPFDLPNPLGGTVHLLLDLNLTSVTIDFSADGTVSADGMVTTTPCLADWNHNGVVNSQDFFDFLTSFFGGGADFNCSGTTDSQDFFDFLGAYFMGC